MLLLVLEERVRQGEGPTVLAHMHQEIRHSPALDSVLPTAAAGSGPDSDFYTGHSQSGSATDSGDSAQMDPADHCQTVSGLNGSHYPDSA